jgi:hypothetical protein
MEVSSSSVYMLMYTTWPRVAACVCVWYYIYNCQLTDAIDRSLLGSGRGDESSGRKKRKKKEGPGDVAATHLAPTATAALHAGHTLHLHLHLLPSPYCIIHPVCYSCSSLPRSCCIIVLHEHEHAC